MRKEFSEDMTKDEWMERIVKACKEAGTYKACFDAVIDTLAEMMEKRDDAQQQFRDSGGRAVVVHTNKGGASNIVKNPALVVVDDLNKTALAYWRDLGLTPAGLRRIGETVISVKEDGSLEKVLANIGI